MRKRRRRNHTCCRGSRNIKHHACCVPCNETIEHAITLLRREGRLAVGDKLVVATDIVAMDRLVDSVQLRTVR